MSTVDLLRYYESVIRPVAEYACVVWHSSLTKDQSARLESIQRRALKLLYGRDNNETKMLPSLADRREDLAKRFLIVYLIQRTTCTICYLQKEILTLFRNFIVLNSTPVPLRELKVSKTLR